MKTLVIDTGQDIVGIHGVASACYTPYRGSKIAKAIHIIEDADEVVTYNGNVRDFPDLQKFALQYLHTDLKFFGRHIDMRSICWSDRIWGSSLHDTYAIHFDTAPAFADTHEGSNEWTAIRLGSSGSDGNKAR